MNRFTSYVTQKMKLDGWLDPQEAKALKDHVKALQTQYGFGYGVSCMARNCLPAIQSVRDGTLTLDGMEKWLQAVITNDAEYLKVARQMVANKSTHTPNDR